MQLAPIARRVARDLYQNADRTSPEVVRDACDLASGGDLDSLQLDLLCETVERLLNGPQRYTLGLL